MAAAAEVRLKLLVDSKEDRVLFGEADKNFIDFLFNLLSLPLGTVIRLLQEQHMVGSLGNLYASVESLNDTYLQPNKTKDSLLKPKVSLCASSAMLLPNIDSSAATETKFYWCRNRCSGYIAKDPKATCPNCSRSMDLVCQFVHPSGASTQATTSVEEGGYVKGVVTYMVMDDLTVTPMSTISSITLLNKFNIKDVGSLEEKIITFDVNEGVKLLRASLQSKTVLTDVFFGKKKLGKFDK